MSESLRAYLDFATETAYLAGRLTLGYFQVGIRPDLKADESVVTVADRQAEELIRERIATQYPQHAIVGEEYGVQGDPGASHRWFIDPIDGTRAFLRGVPLYSVLLGLEIEGTVDVGAVYFPALDEMIAAATAHGCWWNGRRAQVSEVPTLGEAVVTFTGPANFRKYGREAAWNRFQRLTDYQAGWTDAYGYLLVATGRVEIALDPIMSIWDSAPWPPILQEAGGYFGDWQGNVTISAGEAMATNSVLLPQVLALIRGE